jgi:hypothetical protein
MNFTRLKLYHFPASRSARVKWLLHELLEDDFDVEVVPCMTVSNTARTTCKKTRTTMFPRWKLRWRMASAT